jgi:hypothetical protein
MANPTTRSAWTHAFDRLALASFAPWARLQGYRFVLAATPQQMADARRVKGDVYGEMGIAPVAELAEWGQKYDAAAQSFVAYHRGRAVGTLSLLDISRASLLFDVVPVTLPPGVDRARVWEMGRLCIVPASRGRSNIVMTGLLREMCLFSDRRGIRHWVAMSTRVVYRLAHHFNPSARVLSPDPTTLPDPTALRYVASYLKAIGGHPIVYIMDADGFSPWAVFSRHLRSWRPPALFRAVRVSRMA